MVKRLGFNQHQMSEKKHTVYKSLKIKKKTTTQFDRKQRKEKKLKFNK